MTGLIISADTDFARLRRSIHILITAGVDCPTLEEIRDTGMDADQCAVFIDLSIREAGADTEDVERFRAINRIIATNYAEDNQPQEQEFEAKQRDGPSA